MTTIQDINTMIEQQGQAFDNWRAKQEAKLGELGSVVNELALKAGRPNLGAPTQGADPAELKALNLGARALILGDQQKAFEHFREAKAMNASTGPDGAYLTHSVFSNTFTKVMQEISPVYRLARKIPLQFGEGDAFEEPIDTQAMDATWTGEQSTRTEVDTPKLGMFRVPLDEIYTMPKVSQKLLDVASFDPMNWLTAKCSEAFALKEGVAFHTGDGVSKPRGFMEYTLSTAGDATRPFGQVQYIFTGASGAFPTSSTTVNPADILVDVVSAMKTQYRPGAVWLMNRTTAGVCRKLKDAEGRHVWVDSLVQGQPPVLLGYPVEIDEGMPDIGANALAIAFANLQKAYTIVELPGARFLADPYSAKPHVLLYAYRRVGGGCNNTEAVKLLKFGTS